MLDRGDHRIYPAKKIKNTPTGSIFKWQKLLAFQYLLVVQISSPIEFNIDNVFTFIFLYNNKGLLFQILILRDFHVNFSRMPVMLLVSWLCFLVIYITADSEHFQASDIGKVTDVVHATTTPTLGFEYPAKRYSVLQHHGLSLCPTDNMHSGKSHKFQLTNVFFLSFD